ncbi:unnamed protein product [Caenorhabditis angaria]|uniref:Uncharacterized protein n=1 Tax=Caenorhabditis angaria TaxID=860376 RepID=A0A9P1MVE9_9PELO|nr:unnamed protein product [Caenorhabditis angaria]
MFGAPYSIWFIVGIVSIIIILIAIALFVYAIKSENARWMIPHLSAQIFLVLFLFIVSFIVTILLLVGAYSGIRNLIGISKEYYSDDAMFLVGVLMLLIYTLIALLELFFIYIVYRLYRHMCHYESIANLEHENREKWQVVGDFPKDNKHGSPTMGDLYPYNSNDASYI